MSRSARPAPIILEVAAATLVPSAVYGFSRVFVDTAAITPIFGAAMLSTAVAVLLRRLRVPLSLAALLSAGFLLALVINRFAPGTGLFGFIPTGATRAQADLLIDDLVASFQELQAPVEGLDPFIAAAMIGAWTMAFLTDWGALRLRLAFEPVLPAGLLFIFSAILGTATKQVVASAVFGAAIAFWAVTQRAINMAEGNAWLANDRRRGSISIAQAAAAFSVLALVTGVIVGPRLPGAAAEEMLSFRDTGDPTRIVVSPYVDLENRLVQQTGRNLFTVTADQPAYWRLAGLDNYEDNIWKVAGNFSPENGDLPGEDGLGGQRNLNRQAYSIEGLSAIWLPGAFSPSSIEETTADLTWNQSTSSLTVANGIPTSDGVDYTLISSVPNFTPDELRLAPELLPDEITQQFLPINADVPLELREEAIRVTQDFPSRYEKMLALQEYFRTQYTYSLDLGPSDGRDPITQFLQDRVGFCQQFSGTFALMARQLGIPARVAIGFTWGDPIGEDEEGRTIYQVTGRQAHAWPEVWFAGLGWVAFEPTPGRGAPAAVSYTGLPALQDSLVQPDDPMGPVTTTETTAPDVDAPVPEIAVDPGFDVGEQGGDSAGSDSGGLLSSGATQRFLIFVAIVGAYAGGIPLWIWFKRRRRRQNIDSPASSIETAWAEVGESLDLGYGLSRRPSETRREFAGRLTNDMRVPRQPIRELAELATVARYYPGGLSSGRAEQADVLASEIEASVNERVTPFTRWQKQVDPRRLRRRAKSSRPVTPGIGEENLTSVGSARR